MLRQKIAEAIEQGTPLAWADYIPKDGPYPRGGMRVLPLELRAGGRVLCQYESGEERVLRSRNLLTTWEKYREVRERVEAQQAAARAEREAFDERAVRAAEAIGGGAQRSSRPYLGRVTHGVWVPIERAEEVVALLALVEQPLATPPMH